MSGNRHLYRMDDSALMEPVQQLWRELGSIRKVGTALCLGDARVHRILSELGLAPDEPEPEEEAAPILRGSAMLIEAIRRHHPDRCGVAA